MRIPQKTPAYDELDARYREEGWGCVTDAALGIRPVDVESQARDVARWAAARIEILQAELSIQSQLNMLLVHRLQEAERENSALAAGQCVVDGGLVGDDWGNLVCTMRKHAGKSDEWRETATTWLKRAEQAEAGRDSLRHELAACEAHFKSAIEKHLVERDKYRNALKPLALMAEAWGLRSAELSASLELLKDDPDIAALLTEEPHHG